MNTFKTSIRAMPPGRPSFKHHVFNCAAGIAAAALLLGGSVAVNAETKGLEKEELKFGFIKLTDMAPIAIAYEKGYFEDEGLYVTVEAQANWKVLLDGVIDGKLDGAHMLAGQPLGATIGFGTKADIITAFSMDLNGNAITVSNDIWKQMKQHVPHKDGMPMSVPPWLPRMQPRLLRKPPRMQPRLQKMLPRTQPRLQKMLPGTQPRLQKMLPGMQPKMEQIIPAIITNTG